MPKVDLDPRGYNSWQMIAFERVTGRSMLRIFNECFDDEGVLLDMPAEVMVALSWVAEQPPEPTTPDTELRAAFTAYAAVTNYGELIDSLGAGEPDPTLAAEAATTVDSSPRPRPRSARSTPATPSTV